MRRTIKEVISSAGEGIDYDIRPLWKYLIYLVYTGFQGARSFLQIHIWKKPHSKKIIIFDHIPKTAGTTFYSSYLRSAFPADERYFIRYNSVYQWFDFLLARSLLSLADSKVSIVAGHECKIFRKDFPQAKYITLVRDPMEKVISSLFHVIFHARKSAIKPNEIDIPKLLTNYVETGTVHGANAPFSRRAKNMLIKRLLNRDFKAARVNQLFSRDALTLLGVEFDRYAERINHSTLKSDLDECIDQIRNRFYLVGITERFDDFLFLLHMELGWPLLLVRNRLVRAERAGHRPSAEDLACIEKHNLFDRILYERLKQEFSERLDRVVVGEASLVLERYRKAANEFRLAAPDDQSIAEPYVDEIQVGPRRDLPDPLVRMQSAVGVDLAHTGDGIHVTTLKASWSDAIAIPLGEIINISSQDNRPVVALIELLVQEGAVGVSLSDPKTGRANWEAIRVPRHGPSQLAIPLAKPKDAIALIFRNVSPTGASRFVLHGIAYHGLRPIPGSKTDQ